MIRDQKIRKKVEYSYKEEINVVDSSEIKTITEYYSFDPEIIRSKRHWKNGKKDSVWVVYSKDGSIVSLERYKNNLLADPTKK